MHLDLKQIMQNPSLWQQQKRRCTMFLWVSRSCSSFHLETALSLKMQKCLWTPCSGLPLPFPLSFSLLLILFVCLFFLAPFSHMLWTQVVELNDLKKLPALSINLCDICCDHRCWSHQCIRYPATYTTPSSWTHFFMILLKWYDGISWYIWCAIMARWDAFFVLTS